MSSFASEFLAAVDFNEKKFHLLTSSFGIKFGTARHDPNRSLYGVLDPCVAIQFRLGYRVSSLHPRF